MSCLERGIDTSSHTFCRLLFNFREFWTFVSESQSSLISFTLLSRFLIPYMYGMMR